MRTRKFSVPLNRKFSENLERVPGNGMIQFQEFFSSQNLNLGPDNSMLVLDITYHQIIKGTRHHPCQYIHGIEEEHRSKCMRPGKQKGRRRGPFGISAGPSATPCSNLQRT